MSKKSKKAQKDNFQELVNFLSETTDKEVISSRLKEVLRDTTLGNFKRFEKLVKKLVKKEVKSLFAEEPVSQYKIAGSTPICEVGFSTRVVHCLDIRSNVDTLQDLSEYRLQDLRNLKGMGPESIRNIHSVMSKIGYSMIE